jgi:hypothetical protein
MLLHLRSSLNTGRHHRSERRHDGSRFGYRGTATPAPQGEDNHAKHNIAIAKQFAKALTGSRGVLAYFTRRF